MGQFTAAGPSTVQGQFTHSILRIINDLQELTLTRLIYWYQGLEKMIIKLAQAARAGKR